MHLQKAAKKLNYKVGSFPLAEQQANSLITLPVHQYLNSKHMNYIIKKSIVFMLKNFNEIYKFKNMVEINLLKSLPKSQRNTDERKYKKTTKHIKISKEYGHMYFDGPREYGYGGYFYDGRWKPVAQDIFEHFLN